MRGEASHARLVCAVLFAVTTGLMAPPAGAQPDPASADAADSQGTFLRPDALGNPAIEDMSTLPEPFTPATGQQQVPPMRPGTNASPERQERLRQAKPPERIHWFSAVQPGLAPYLSNLDEFGNTAVVPGAMTEDLVSRAVQRAKYRLSEYGLHYHIEQALEYATLTHVPPEERPLGYYAFKLAARQTVFTIPGAGVGGWISGEFVGGAGLGARSRRFPPLDSLGAIVNPAATLSPVDGVLVNELAWMQSFAGGRAAVVVGHIDPTNYLDANAYANSEFSQFQNSALVNSQVLPLTAGNIGGVLQWQPIDQAYLLLGVGSNDTPPAHAPWSVNGDNLSYTLEMGWVPDDVRGLGPGAYRVQPFAATVAGVTQAGVGLNVNQQLGAASPLGVFGRFGIAGPAVGAAGGASAQVGTGLILQHPFTLVGLFEESSTDFLGLGFVWSQPAAVRRPAAHFNEYGLELTYALQITHTLVFKPDLQVIWNPATNAAIEDSVVVQLPFVATW